MTTTDFDTAPDAAAAAITAPPLALLLREARVLLELPRFLLRTRSTRGLPRGDGHAVLVIPGFGADDLTTLALRRALGQLGYATSGWGLGRNLGMRNGMRERLSQRLLELSKAHGPVSLVGWSLGGVFARELARHHAARVRHVYSLGSPINGNPDANNMQALFRLANRGAPAKTDWAAFNRRRQPPPVPCTAIYSRSDGIVAWQCSLEPDAANTESVEVDGSHFGLVCNTQVLEALATRLARPLAD